MSDCMILVYHTDIHSENGGHSEVQMEIVTGTIRKKHNL